MMATTSPPTLFVFQDLWSSTQPGGAGTVFRHQALRLAEAGYVVHAIYGCPDPAANQGVGGAVVDHVYPIDLARPTWHRFLSAGLGLRKLFKRELSGIACDGWLTHHSMAVFTLNLRPQRRPPFLYIYHSPWHREHRLNRRLAKEAHSAGARVRQLLERRVVRRADRLVVLSDYMKQELLMAHPSIDGARVTVVPGGANLTAFDAARERTNDVRAELNFDPNDFHLFTARRHVPRMGLDLLVVAMHRLVADGIPVRLSIAGDGPERPQLEALATEGAAAERIQFVGKISNEALRNTMAAADLFVLPTRDLEGFGLVTVESLASGTPVVATPVGGSVEILRKLEPGLLANNVTADALAERIRHWHDEREALAAVGSRANAFAARNYNWGKHVDGLRQAMVDTDIPAVAQPDGQTHAD